ncbi:MAG: hypothetical protein JNM22_21925 [Saprospiraceae bacterium]|nr:hypothetical protein [Saprospiraceae bacterium]
MHNRFSFLLCFLFALLACQQGATVAPKSPQPQQVFFIPEVGIEVQFPAYPEFNSQINPAYLKDFSEGRSYEFYRTYHRDTIPFGARVGVYYNRSGMNVPALLDDGLQAFRKMMKPIKTQTTLLDEQTQFLGRPAQRIKLYMDGENASTASFLLFTVGPYFVELSVFDPVERGDMDHTWKDQPFFQSVSLKDTVSTHILRQVHNEEENCLLLPCYFKDQQLIAWFPGAPEVKRVEMMPGLNVTKYRVAPAEDQNTLFYAVEFFERTPPLGSLPDSIYIEIFMKTGEWGMKFSDNEKLISSRKIQYKGKYAMEMHTRATLPPGNDDIPDMDIDYLLFVHQGRVVRMFTCRKAGFLESYAAACFWDWLVLL